MISQDGARTAADLDFMAAVALRFQTPLAVGETPDGVRFDFKIEGTVQGPQLNGRFPSCMAYLLIDPDGIGTIVVRAPLLLNDGAIAELEATGRYFFGNDGYRRAIAGDLPNSTLGWCPRFLTGHPRYQWLNRTLCLGIGELRPKEARVDYDLFSVRGGQGGGTCPPAAYSTGGYSAVPSALPASALPTSAVPTSELPTALPASALPSTAAPPQYPAPYGSLYDRLGGRSGIRGISADWIDALVNNGQLNRQNPKVAQAHGRLREGPIREQGIEVLTNLFCQLTGGPCQYSGRSLRESHAPLNISQADWLIGIAELKNVLGRHRVGQAEREEFVSVIERTRSDIVTRR
jgi:hemoglobin